MNVRRACLGSDRCLYGYALADPVNRADPSGAFSISLKSVGNAIGHVVPMSVSKGALGILNVLSGGAATDIACNGLDWGNGLSFAMVLLPGEGRLLRLGADAAKAAKEAAAARQTLTNVLKNIHSRGSTAEAVLREGVTGQATGGRYHLIKAAESAHALNKLIASGQLTGRHLERAINERDQLLSALLAAGIRG